MNKTYGFLNHKVFQSIENKQHFHKKPQTSHIKQRELPDIESKIQINSFKNRLSESQQNFFNFQNEDCRKIEQQKYVKKTSIKLKLLRNKRRTISKCSLGIGFQNSAQSLCDSNFKLSQHFFPQRSLTLFKKLAFKNSNSKLQSQKYLLKKDETQFKKQKKKVKLRFGKDADNQNMDIQIRQPTPECQILIKTVISAPIIKIKPDRSLTQKNVLRIHQKNSHHNKSIGNYFLNQQFPSKNFVIQTNELSPWDFQQGDNKETQIYAN